MSCYVRFDSVSFKYENSPNLLFSDINFSFTSGWTGLVGANGTGSMFSALFGNYRRRLFLHVRLFKRVVGIPPFTGY